MSWRFEGIACPPPHTLSGQSHCFGTWSSVQVEKDHIIVVQKICDNSTNKLVSTRFGLMCLAWPCQDTWLRGVAIPSQNASIELLHGMQKMIQKVPLSANWCSITLQQLWGLVLESWQENPNSRRVPQAQQHPHCALFVPYIVWFTHLWALLHSCLSSSTLL